VGYFFSFFLSFFLSFFFYTNFLPSSGEHIFGNIAVLFALDEVFWWGLIF